MPESATPHVEMGCPVCGHALRVRAEFAGQRVLCRYCGHPFDVPRDLPAPAPGSPETAPDPGQDPSGAELPCVHGVPGYEVLDLLSDGSMGRVYRARQRSVDRVVAVKVMHDRLARAPEFHARFLHEARVAANFAHTNVVHLIDAGTVGGCPYLVMEFVDGETAMERLDASGPFDEHAATGIVLAVAEALRHVHELGFIHRDVKPANVMLARDGAVKLIDFGLARALSDDDWATAEAGNAIGSPEYISPEQVRGQTDVDPRSDIYSLGATFYHLVTGRPLFHGTSAEVLRQQAEIHTRPVTPGELVPGLSRGLEDVIARMTAKNRGERYHDMTHLIVDLRRLSWGEGPATAEPADGLAPTDGAADGRHFEAENAGAAAAPAEPPPPETPARLVESLTEDLRREPGRARTYRLRGDAYARLGAYDRALADYTEGLRIDPTDPPALVRRGTLHHRLGDYRQARADLYAAVGLAPDFPAALNRLARLLATCPDPHLRDGWAAVAAATRACELSGWSDPHRLDTLAAASAEAGEYAAAADWQTRALALLSGSSPLRHPFLDRLAAYQAGQPLRETTPE